MLKDEFRNRKKVEGCYQKKVNREKLALNERGGDNGKGKWTISYELLEK